jgi:hypothetical protein
MTAASGGDALHSGQRRAGVWHAPRVRSP